MYIYIYIYKCIYIYIYCVHPVCTSHMSHWSHIRTWGGPTWEIPWPHDLSPFRSFHQDPVQAQLGYYTDMHEESRQLSFFSVAEIWVWVNTYRYIFSGMNIHLPAILGSTRGTRVLTHPHLAKSNMNHERWLLRRLCLHMGQILCTVKSLHDPFLSFANGVNGLAIQRSILELYMHMLPWVEVATEQNSLRLAEWFERTEWLLMIAALRLWFFGTQIATKTCKAKLKLAKKRKERADEAVNQTTIYWC